MIDLIAQGPEAPQRWRKTVVPAESCTLGRGARADLSVPWDTHISREHVRISAADGVLHVERLSAGANPLFFEGRQVEECTVRIGEHFVIGSTSFFAQATEGDPSPDVQPVEEVTFNRQELRKVRFQDADKRLEVLSNLPEVIWGTRTDSELHHRLANLLLAGVMHAEAVAIVTVDPPDEVRVLHWERRRETSGEFTPSSRLVIEAIAKRRSSMLHVWDKESRKSDLPGEVYEFDWAFCTPIRGLVGEPWGLYLAGKMGRAIIPGATLSDALQLDADVKFTELVAEIISSVRRLNRLERQQAGLRQFFAPPILKALGDDLDTTLLEPRECEVTVMFCDLRGFSQQAEHSAGNLIGLLDRVSRALGVMTEQILAHGGVTGDFQGDAALGFWGWPFPSDEAVLNACRAALRIRAAFGKTVGKKHHPLADFEMGIGIAHGRAVAGKIGTSEQVKVTVFGPVVNLASRLESMTKQLRVPILLDQQTAELVRRKLDPSEGRIRRLARVLPYGMESPVLVSELLPPESEMPELSEDHLRQYERGVDHFQAGEWDDAYRCLHAMPASDRAQDFLMLLLAQHNRVAPPGWDGIVRMPSK